MPVNLSDLRNALIPMDTVTGTECLRDTFSDKSGSTKSKIGRVALACLKMPWESMKQTVMNFAVLA